MWIATEAVDRTLASVRKDTFFQTRLADFFRNAFAIEEKIREYRPPRS